ncbi:MAG: hypothetical protein ABGX07_12865, partial [Pirellulaceae bacterium]
SVVAQNNSVPPDGKQRTIRFPLQQAGLYRIELNDGMDMTQVTWPDSQSMTMKMTIDDHPRMFSGRWSLWFYVPRGTTKIGLYVDTSGGSVLRPDGESFLKLDKKPGEFVSIDVPTDMDGKLWRLHQVAGTVCLMNVPPYVARSPEELLLPAAVIRNARQE